MAGEVPGNVRHLHFRVSGEDNCFRVEACQRWLSWEAFFRVEACERWQSWEAFSRVERGMTEVAEL